MEFTSFCKLLAEKQGRFSIDSVKQTLKNFKFFLSIFQYARMKNLVLGFSYVLEFYSLLRGNVRCKTSLIVIEIGDRKLVYCGKAYFFGIRIMIPICGQKLMQFS
jgi:hypothetical protein